MMKHLPLLTLTILLTFTSIALSDPPPELREAERKYGNAVKKIVGNAKDNFQARSQLFELNKSYVKHLEKLELEFLAKDREAAKEVSSRMAEMKTKLDPNLAHTELDGRKKLVEMGDEIGETKTGGDKPTGSFSDPREGIEVLLGDYLVLEGRTRDVPRGHVVRIFEKMNWGGIFPGDVPKDPNRKFVTRFQISTNHLGNLEAYLFSLPEELSEDIDPWYQARRIWADAGFKPEDTPELRGAKAKELSLDLLEKLGATKLATFKYKGVE